MPNRTNLDLNSALVWCEAQRIIEQISKGAVEQNGIGKNFRIPTATDLNVSVFGESLIEAHNFFDRGAPVERRTINLLFGRVGAGEKEKIINNAGKTLTLCCGRLDDIAIFIRTTITREGDLGFAQHIS